MGIIYSATDDSGKVVSPPIKSARFGKRFGNTGLSERMLRHTQDFKEGRWSPAISGKVVWAMRNAKSEQEFRELLKQEHIDVVFRRNDTRRIYGVTFIDHERREAFNGSRMGKEFSANVFNGLVNWWEGIPWQDRQQSGRRNFGNGTATVWKKAVRLNRRQASYHLMQIQLSITRKKRSVAA